MHGVLRGDAVAHPLRQCGELGDARRPVPPVGVDAVRQEVHERVDESGGKSGVGDDQCGECQALRLPAGAKPTPRDPCGSDKR